MFCFGVAYRGRPADKRCSRSPSGTAGVGAIPFIRRHEAVLRADRRNAALVCHEGEESVLLVHAILAPKRGVCPRSSPAHRWPAVRTAGATRGTPGIDARGSVADGIEGGAGGQPADVLDAARPARPDQRSRSRRCPRACRSMGDVSGKLSRGVGVVGAVVAPVKSRRLDPVYTSMFCHPR